MIEGDKIIEPGTWAIDNSKHRYETGIGYEWIVFGRDGISRRGIAKTKEEAEIQVKYTLKEIAG